MMFALALLIVVAGFLFFAWRQRSLTFRAGSATRMIKMLDRTRTTQDAFFAGRSDQDIMRSVRNCDACPDHKACDIYLKTEGEECPGFCPNRESFINKSS